MKPKDYFTPGQQRQIVEAIEEAERQTSGEIRVHVEWQCKVPNPLDRAAQVFAMLKMHKTKLRNGVLFYLSISDHKFAILGDADINNKVPVGFWDNIKEAMISEFKENRLTEGLVTGIKMAGEQLAVHFPYDAKTDINELSDEISFG
ncbi:MAG TPA: TPM domain-containing protein [Bacteroidales bacterium]|nr:TPM domain-containing protein [Bacteroidales bacterium]